MRQRLPVLVALAAVGVAVLLIAVIGRAGDDGGSNPATQGDGRLPAATTRTAPTDYRILYRVTTPDGVTSEEHVVHRPFVAEVTVRDKQGKVVGQRWSDVGHLVTQSQGAPAVRIDTAIAPAASDLRPDRFGDAVVEAKRAIRHTEVQDIGGRECAFDVERSEITTADDSGATSTSAPGSVPVIVSRCIDPQGLVLEEQWTTKEGVRALTKRAVELDLGDEVPDIHVPKADPLGSAQGNGAVQKVPADQAPPFAEVWHLDPPEGFTLVGRYAVVPARLNLATGDATPGQPEVALYTDVWRRGTDVLLLDQGATRGGPPPFDASTRVGTVDLGPLGQGELAVDLRSAEVRLARPDHGFVRLSGTIPIDELTQLATQLKVLEEAR
jgi:hypothetical protein